MSTVHTALVIGAPYGAFLLGGGSVIISLFFIAVAGTGLLTTVGVIVASVGTGPVGQRAGHRGDVRRRARGRHADPHRARRGRQHHQGDHQRHAIATAVLAATALFGSYTDAVRSP